MVRLLLSSIFLSIMRSRRLKFVGWQEFPRMAWQCHGLQEDGPAQRMAAPSLVASRSFHSFFRFRLVFRLRLRDSVRLRSHAFPPSDSTTGCSTVATVVPPGFPQRFSKVPIDSSFPRIRGSLSSWTAQRAGVAVGATSRFKNLLHVIADGRSASARAQFPQRFPHRFPCIPSFSFPRSA